MTELEPAGSFVQLLSAELHRLKRTAQQRSFPAGHVIFRQGDQGDGVYVLEEGRVAISTPIDEAENRVLSRFGPGDFFGEMAVIDNQPRSATATAETDTVVSFIPREEMLRALAEAPELLVALVREFAHRIRQFDRRFIEEVLQAARLTLVGRFAQSIIHDFKTPLSIINLAAELVAGDDATPGHRSAAKKQIRRQVDRMANMVNELLEFTRGSSRPVKLEPVGYREFVQEFLQEIEPEAGDKAVQIECANPPPDVTLQFDRARLVHVLYNLANNAIDMMPDGGKLTLRFAVGHGGLLTEVEDTGPGLAPEIRERLFQPFVTHGKLCGTGLGLSICKKIIEDHGGHIQARNLPGRGAAFSFTLPLPQAAP